MRPIQNCLLLSRNDDFFFTSKRDFFRESKYANVMCDRVPIVFWMLEDVGARNIENSSAIFNFFRGLDVVRSEEDCNVTRFIGTVSYGIHN